MSRPCAPTWTPRHVSLDLCRVLSPVFWTWYMEFQDFLVRFWKPALDSAHIAFHHVHIGHILQFRIFKVACIGITPYVFGPCWLSGLRYTLAEYMQINS